jgi:23S rRNA (adenine2503-C2)-methyltransferase
MEIVRNIKVPTGNILVVQGDRGKLECLSLGDYGKENNIKADFLGLTRDFDKVEHTNLLPLEDKWVVTISTQYGCSMNCKFCDVPKVGPGKNATENDLVNQVLLSMSLHPEVKSTNRLNIHYARMGEPTWNPNVLTATKRIYEIINDKFHIHPVVSTMMPKKNKKLFTFLNDWMVIKNELLKGEAGLQLSINSTDDNERDDMFNGNSFTLKQIGFYFKDVGVVGRKITLNFAVADYTIDAELLRKYFDPEKFNKLAEERHNEYVNASPFAHTVLFDLFDNNVLQKANLTNIK